MEATDLYNAEFIDHVAHPDYKYQMNDPSIVHEGVNPSCGDDLTLSVKLGDDGKIEEAAYTGHGCAVSQASADMMAGLLEGESIEEAKRLSGLFIGMIQGNELSDEDKEDLDEAAELQSISRMPARVKCAELAWRTLNGILSERDKELAGK